MCMPLSFKLDIIVNVYQLLLQGLNHFFVHLHRNSVTLQQSVST